MFKNLSLLCTMILCGVVLSRELSPQEQQNIQEKTVEEFAKIIFERAMEAKRAFHAANQVRDAVIDNFATTAPMENFVAHADIDAILADGIISSSINVSMDNQNSWQSAPANLLGTPGYENTWESIVPTSNGSTSHSYLSGVISSEALGYDYGTIIVSGSPHNEAGLFPLPANMYATLSEDPAGDAPSAQDILAINASYRGSDAIDADGNEYTDVDRYYLEMELNGSCCETDPGGFLGFLGPFYLYGMAIVNPEAVDAVAYAVGYGDGGFGQLTPGVLKITGDLATGEIGGFEYLTTSLNYNISGNKLQASSPMSIITNDSDWGNWPNSYNGFITLGVTVSAGLDGADVSADILDQSNPGLFVCNTSSQSGNSLLELSNAQFDESSNVLSIDYIDSDGNLPWFKKAEICPGYDEPCYGAFDLIPDSHVYDEIVTFSAVIPQDLIDIAVDSAGPGEFIAKFWFADDDISEYPNAQLGIPINLGDEGGACSNPGDANEDTITNVLDVVVIVGYILDPLAEASPCSDVNGDGILNVLDVVLLVDFILNP